MTSLDGINGRSIQTLLRGENDSKQSDEFQANDCEDKLQRPAPKIRITEVSNKKTRKRKQSGNDQLNDCVQFKKVALDDDIVHENIDLDTAPLSPASEFLAFRGAQRWFEWHNL